MSNDAPVEMSIDVLEERIPEEQRGRGKKNERWYCQLYAHKDLPCAQIGEPTKPVNEPGIRHYSSDFYTKRSSYAEKIREERKISADERVNSSPQKLTKGASLHVMEASTEGKSLVAADVFHCIDADHTQQQCYKRLWSLTELKNFGDEHMWEIDQDAVKAAAAKEVSQPVLSKAKPEQSVAEFLRSNIREFKGLYEDQYEMVAVRGKLTGRHESGKLIVQLPGGVIASFTPEEIVGVFEEYMPGEPPRRHTMITMENGSKVWRFIRGGWLDITSRDAVPLSWRKLWKQYEANLQFWRNHDA